MSPSRKIPAPRTVVHPGRDEAASDAQAQNVTPIVRGLVNGLEAFFQSKPRPPAPSVAATPDASAVSEPPARWGRTTPLICIGLISSVAVASARDIGARLDLADGMPGFGPVSPTRFGALSGDRS